MGGVRDLHKFPMIKDYEEEIPWIAWREPQLATNADTGEQGLACRFCIAMKGLKGYEIGSLPHSEEAFRQHMKEAHGLE